MLVLAHRGCPSKQCSENTVSAFQEALKCGADGIEFDLRLSRDGEPVVIHDANLHRIAGNAHHVSELEARAISKVTLRFGGNIPTLDEVTASIPAPAILDIEVKHHNVLKALIAKLKTSAALRERTIVSSFNKKVLQITKEQTPDIRTLLLISRWPLPLRGRNLWDLLKDMDPWAVAFPLMLMTPGRADFLRSLGLRIGAWDRRGSRGEARKAAALDLDVAIVRHIEEARVVGGLE